MLCTLVLVGLPVVFDLLLNAVESTPGHDLKLVRERGGLLRTHKDLATLSEPETHILVKRASDSKGKRPMIDGDKPRAEKVKTLSIDVSNSREDAFIAMDGIESNSHNEIGQFSGKKTYSNSPRVIGGGPVRYQPYARPTRVQPRGARGFGKVQNIKGIAMIRRPLRLFDGTTAKLPSPDIVEMVKQMRGYRIEPYSKLGKIIEDSSQTSLAIPNHLLTPAESSNQAKTESGSISGEKSRLSRSVTARHSSNVASSSLEDGLEGLHLHSPSSLTIGHHSHHSKLGKQEIEYRVSPGQSPTRIHDAAAMDTSSDSG